MVRGVVLVMTRCMGFWGVLGVLEVCGGDEVVRGVVMIMTRCIEVCWDVLGCFGVVLGCVGVC